MGSNENKQRKRLIEDRLKQVYPNFEATQNVLNYFLAIQESCENENEKFIQNTHHMVDYIPPFNLMALHFLRMLCILRYSKS